MKSAAIGPWPKGMINTVRPTAVPADALVEAVNVDIDKAGHITSRTSWTQVDPGVATSLFTHAGKTYGVVDSIVGELRADGFEGYSYVVGKIAWSVLNGVPIFASYDGVYQIVNRVVSRLDTGSATPDEAVELMLTPLPGGQWVEYWQGRVIVARGTTLFFSEPLRYGVYDPLRGYIQFEQQISWMAPLESGIYVGLRDTVRFLKGSDYRTLEQHLVDNKSWPGTAAVLTAPNLSSESLGVAGNAPERVAVWMTDVGFAVGLPTGDVSHPQQDRLKGIPVTPGRMVVTDDRITVLPTLE
jgi:hypothetical protein